MPRKPLTTRKRNLLGSKEFFFFSSEAVEAKALETYKKAQKSAEGALDNISWAAHTGKGLLFSGDKKAPHTVINLVSLHISTGSFAQCKQQR